MASGNQGQGQGQGQARRVEGRQNGGMRETAQGIGQSAQKGYEQVTNRLHEGYDATREEVARRYRHAEGMAARNPSASVIIGFGVGLGLGLALTTLFAGEEETWADRHLPDSLRDFPGRLGKLRASDVAREIPDSWQHSFHHLAESIRDLPAAIARHMPGR